METVNHARPRRERDNTTPVDAGPHQTDFSIRHVYANTAREIGPQCSCIVLLCGLHNQQVYRSSGSLNNYRVFAESWPNLILL